MRSNVFQTSVHFTEQDRKSPKNRKIQIKLEWETTLIPNFA